MGVEHWMLEDRCGWWMKMKLELKLVFPAAGIRHVQFVSVPPPSLVNRQSKFFLGGFMAFEQKRVYTTPAEKSPERAR